MKKVIFTIAMLCAAITFTSCRGYEREQDRLDKESDGKGDLLKAESTKKVMIEQAKADYESAQLDAKTKVTKAESSAKAKVINAKAEAEERLIYAKSKAESNRMIEQSLTPELLDYMKIDRWNGKTPTVVGAGSNTIIDLK